MRLLTPGNVGIVIASAALVCVLWFAWLQPTDERREGARTYCERLRDNGLLIEPMRDCIAEVLRAR